MTARPEEFRMPLGEHLEELRGRLIICLVAPLTLAIPALIFGKPILAWLLRPIQAAMTDAGLVGRLQLLSPMEPLVSYFKIALLVAVLVAAPVILWQLWRFIEPGLYQREKKFVYLLLPGSVTLLVIGVAFNYYLVFPLTLRMLVGFAQTMQPIASLAPPEGVTTPPEIIEKFFTAPRYPYDPPELKPGEFYFNTTVNQLRTVDEEGRYFGIDAQVDTGFAQQYEIKAYLGMLLSMTVAFALAFQLPLILLLMGWIGIVDVASLRRYRKHALLGCAVASAILTPPDVTSQIALLIPLYLLYELSIVLLWLMPGSRASAE